MDKINRKQRKNKKYKTNWFYQKVRKHINKKIKWTCKNSDRSTKQIQKKLIKNKIQEQDGPDKLKKKKKNKPAT